ncbi:hypothetical protein ILUMI_06207 [Ignelater luminosus]|uniref:Uncharacterized protein n=1 Tax=Ignelater luminosus TaxID=2038154 RepID=A0A8K0DBJ2_IGNLU|nr:hypothetical protein ILUMI_06207 [Ignelater luminosus]
MRKGEICKVRWSFAKNKKGELMGEMEEKTEDINEEGYTPAAESEDPPTQQEIAEIIRKLRYNKSPGENGVTTKMLKAGAEKLEKRKIKKKAAKDKGLIINKSKTKLIKIEKTPRTNESEKMKIVTEGSEYELEAAAKCNYLGVEITNTDEEKNEIHEDVKGNNGRIQEKLRGIRATMRFQAVLRQSGTFEFDADAIQFNFITARLTLKEIMLCLDSLPKRDKKNNVTESKKKVLNKEEDDKRA